MGSVARDVVISLGMISATVRVESALYTQDYLTNVCTGHGEHEPLPVKRPLSCDTCGTITMNGLRKAKREAGGFVLLNESEVAALTEDGIPFRGKIALVPFDSGEVMANTSEGEKLYYLTPQTSPENLTLLKQVISAYPNKMFVARYSVRTKASLFVAVVRNDCILLSERVFRERLKPIPPYTEPVNESYVGLAIQMVEMMNAPFDENTFSDTYTKALHEMTRSREVIDGKVPVTAPDTSRVTFDMVQAKLMEYRVRKAAEVAGDI